MCRPRGPATAGGGPRPSRRRQFRDIRCRRSGTRSLRRRCLVVPELAGRMDGAALQHTPGDDPRPESRRRLDDQDIVEWLNLGAPFADRDRVGVVVQDYGGIVSSRNTATVGAPSQPPERRVDTASARPVDGAGQADPHAVHPALGWPESANSRSRRFTTSGIRSPGPRPGSWSMSAVTRCPRRDRRPRAAPD